MNARAWVLGIATAIATVATVLAQGFAGLGTDAEGFAIPERGKALTFPQDHGSHPAYRIEWWYLTSNLTGDDGREYGIQWTLFRSALAPQSGEGWSSPQLWMAHAGLTTPDGHFHAERLARGGVGQAGVSAEPFEAFIDDWSLQSLNMGGDAYDGLQVSATGTDFSYQLRLEASGPLVFQGDKGYSVKSAAGQASYYYSQPFFEVAGTLKLPDRDVNVTGNGWLDREWSSQPLSETQTGWDWVSLHLDGGQKLMGFRLRDRTTAPFTSATWIEADGTATPFTDGALTLTPLEETRVEGRDVPTSWQVQLPEKSVDVRIDAVNPMSWMSVSVPYWEGPVRIEGSHTGRGYLEMTGYGPED
ncbi:MAG: lipocalin-like domain-containing protein [Pseudomonadota bacterium]